MDKQNYARYGSCYINTLENLDITHPGCRELLKYKGLSVQGQEKYSCRVAIGQRGEQTINRDAKVSGGIKYFASDPNSILKWTLNRSAQAKDTEALYGLADIKAPDDIYKSNRPSQITKSEEFVAKIQSVLSTEYVNPFSESLDKESLYNLSSGIPLKSTLTDEILRVKEIGEQCYSDFVDKRIKSTSKKIHDPITRMKCTLFQSVLTFKRPWHIHLVQFHCVMLTPTDRGELQPKVNGSPTVSLLCIHRSQRVMHSQSIRICVPNRINGNGKKFTWVIQYLP